MIPNNSTVRWFHSEMADAPQINAQPGDLINILDACLVNGFGNKAVDSLVVLAGVATVTISAGHLFEELAVIRISGAAPAELNGDWRILTATGTTYTVATPGIADLTATGTITCLRATPGHWEKAFSGEFKAAYRSTHPDATGFFLRIDDAATGTESSRVVGYETMTDIDTGGFPFPTEAQMAGGLHWRRSSTTTGSQLPRPWTLIADERWLWLLLDNNTTPTYPATMHQFGDIIAANPEDAFACALTGQTINTIPANNTSEARLDWNSVVGCYFARPIIFDPEFVPPGYGRQGVFHTSYVADGEPFPAAVNNGYLFHQPVLANARVGTANSLRGVVPGLLQGLTARQETIAPPGATTTTRVILPPGPANPRALLLTSVSAAGGVVSYATFDIEGPWR